MRKKLKEKTPIHCVICETSCLAPLCTEDGAIVPHLLAQMLASLFGQPHSTSCCLSGPYQHLTIIYKQLKMEGFLVTRFEHKHPESLKRLMAWMKEVSK